MPAIQTSQMLPKGTLLHEGAYRIDSYLASGGFGNTYLATNMAFDERVAIKEFFLRGASERTQDLVSIRVTGGQDMLFDEQKAKFKKEAQRIRSLRNSHIVRVHDLFEANGTIYYVMDYVEGESVAAKLKNSAQPMTEEQTRDILLQVLDALRDVHAAGLRHLDIKPDNILIDSCNQAFLIDFGASKMQSSHNEGVTHTSAFTATPGYAPIELTAGNVENIGAWTDIYSVGATAYRMLTKQMPPKADELLITGTKAFHFPEDLSDSMRDFILRCMNIDLRQRPQTADEATALLQKVDAPKAAEKPAAEVVKPKPQPKPVVEQPKPEPKPEPKPQPKQEAPKPKREEEKPKPAFDPNATRIQGQKPVTPPAEKAAPASSSSRKKDDSSKKALYIMLGLVAFVLVLILLFSKCGGKEVETEGVAGMETFMDTDQDLERTLPCTPEDEQQNNEINVKERNLLNIRINKDNWVLIDEDVNVGELKIEKVPTSDGNVRSNSENISHNKKIKDSVKEIAKDFIKNENNLPNLPELFIKNIDLIGQYPVTVNHIISVQADNGTSYSACLEIQDALVTAYEELRDELANEKFGVPFSQCSKEEKDAIRKVYPPKISWKNLKNTDKDNE